MVLKSIGFSLFINFFFEIRFILIYNIKKFDYLKLDMFFLDFLLFFVRVYLWEFKMVLGFVLNNYIICIILIIFCLNWYKYNIFREKKIYLLLYLNM